MKDIPLEKVGAFQDLFLEKMRSVHSEDVLAPLGAGKIDDNIKKIMSDEALRVVKIIQEQN